MGFNEYQITYGKTFNTMKNSNDHHEFELIQTFSKGLNSLTRDFSSFFIREERNYPDLQTFTDSLSDTFFNNRIPELRPLPEKQLSYFCLKYFEGIFELNNQPLIKEIDQWGNIPGIGRFNYLLIGLYERDITILEYLKESLKIDSSLPLAIRYLYIMLMSFEELRIVENTTEISEILVSQVQSKFSKKVQKFYFYFFHLTF